MTTGDTLDTSLPAPDDDGSHRLPGVVRVLRPRQWAKNVLVFVAPFAAGRFFEDGIAARALVAFVAFCLAASATYCLNDVVDAASDRLHPTKRGRPVASGDVSRGVAIVLGAVLLAGAIALAAWLGGPFFPVLLAYVVLTVTYSLWLKRMPVLDVAAIAGGFILRSVAGGAAAPLPISQWFLVLAGFGSLFVVAGKRSAEHLDLGEEAASVRSTLGEYSLEYLRFVRGVAAAVTLAAYCLAAFEVGEERGQPLWYELSIIPFVVGVLYYALRLDQGAGAAPEELVLQDRTLQAIGLVWLALVAAGLYVA